MSIYSYEDKLEAVLRIIEDEMGVKGLITKAGTYDDDFKIFVVEYIHMKQLSPIVTSAKFGIPSKTQVCSWERICYEEGAQVLYRDNRGRKSKMNSNKQKKKLNKKNRRRFNS